MELNVSVNNCKLKDLFEVFASDENLSSHLESFNIEGKYESIKKRTYAATISTSEPAFLNKIIDALKEEDAEQIMDEGQ